jgi:hypothetical protein
MKRAALYLRVSTLDQTTRRIPTESVKGAIRSAPAATRRLATASAGAGSFFLIRLRPPDVTECRGRY